VFDIVFFLPVVVLVVEDGALVTEAKTATVTPATIPPTIITPTKPITAFATGPKVGVPPPPGRLMNKR
jgi:hypothetical protein